jgi:hypothetical protein
MQDSKPKNLPLAMRNVSRVLLNRAAKLYRDLRRRSLRAAKSASQAGETMRATVRQDLIRGRDAARSGYRATVRGARFVRRTNEQFWPRVQREAEAGRHLRAAARGSHPIIVGPWLSEVGYEVLYWIPFLRWYCDRYRVDRSRLVVVSRGGVAGWYHAIAGRYVELLDLFTPDEFVSLNAARYGGGDQKQQGISSFDEAILARVRAREGLASAGVCHPSVMFRLLRQFWLGNESLEYIQQHLAYERLNPPALPLPALPSGFTAVKLYTGKALPDTVENRQLLRALVERLAARGPVVTLDIGVSLDEHEDYRFRDLPNVVSVADWLTPANNLAVQTEVIRRADRFLGTCGSLAWLAPMLGTPTVALYSDDDLLGPHLYAARAAYRSMGAPFTPLDLKALAHVDLPGPENATA